MKTFLSIRGWVTTAAVALGLFTGVPNGAAAPGGGIGFTQGGNPATIAAAGGGRGGATGFGRAGGATLSPGQHLNSPGAAPAQLISPGFAGGRRFNGNAPANPTMNAGLARPNFNQLSRPNFGNGQVGSTNTGIVTSPNPNLGVRSAGSVTNRDGVPTITRRFDGNSAATANVHQQRRSAAVASINAQNARSAALARVPPLARPRNAWTDSRANGITPLAARPGRYGYNPAYDPGQTYLQNGLTPGQHLYPGSYGYSPRGDGNRPALQGRRANRGEYRQRPRYNPYYYTGVYYPYFVGGFFPGDSGYSYGGDFGTYSGLDTGYSATITNDSVGVSSTNNTTAGGYYYDQQGVARDESASTADQSLPPNPPSQVGPSSPEAADRTPSIENGPDSLVEAVQDELAKRGYYPAKADGLYGDGTREALRRFQADRKLSVTGRVNEATLHALQLD